MVKLSNYRPGSGRVRIPEFLENQHMKVVRPYAPAAFTSRIYIPSTHFC
jgi:hypothetical protein